MTKLTVRRLLLWALFATVADGAFAATRYDPRLRFRTISTARFDIHFHQGEDALARRLAGFIEAAAAEIDAAVGAAVGRVQVILVDQHDLSNGWATPLPYNTIEITTAAPAAGDSIGNTTDWLRLVFVHEYTHIAHLSRAGGWIHGLRRGFGRLPLLFPNLYQPVWAIEGIATWQESRGTGEGRVPAGDFRALLNEASRRQRFEPLDRVNGGNVDWPGGNGPYLYGAYFHQFLARKYGDAAIRALSAETAERLPYFGSRAYKKVFGRSLGELWRDFRNDVAAADGGAPELRAARLTWHGFRVSTPRYARDGRIFYSVANPHQFPALMELQPAAAASPSPSRRVTTRYLGRGIGLAGERLLLDEIEMVRSVALQSDLWLVEPGTGRRERVTREARAADPDVAADGQSVVCTIQMADRRPLATLSLTGAAGLLTPQILVSEDATHFAGPRWSPDGRSIVAERRRRGGPAEIVTVDTATQRVSVLASLPGGRSGSPVWMPGGQDVVFAAAVDDGPFSIYRVAVASRALSRLEGTGRSAQSPDVSADGRRLVFVGYTADGHDLFELPLENARWSPVSPIEVSTIPTAHPAQPRSQTGTAAAATTAADYSPWRTLVPAFWTPTVESDAGELVFGTATGSVDSLGRHAYGIEAGWAARLRPDWQAAYAYDRWRPTVFAALADDTDPWRDGERRSREFDAGLLLPFRQVRDTRSLLAGVHVGGERFECRRCDSPAAALFRRASLRGAVAYSNAHEFGYSIGAEEGGRVTGTIEISRGRADMDGSRSTGSGAAVTADVRRYWRAWPRHGVIALRGAAAGSWGHDAALTVFSASGNGPQSGGFGFGTDAIGLLRGFDEDEVLGSRAAVANADWRVPLWRVGRGAGTIPLFVRTLHAAVFVDAGHAWTQSLRPADLRLSAGAELSSDVVVGFVLPLTFTAGIAVRRDGGEARGRATVFARIGRAF